MSDPVTDPTGQILQPRTMWGYKDDGTPTKVLVDADGKVVVSGASVPGNISLDAVNGTAQTGRNWSADLSKLDIALSALRDAVKGAGGKDLTTLDTLLTAALGTVLPDLKKGAENADGVAVETASVLKALARLSGFNGTNWDRLRSSGDNNDGVSVRTLGLLNVLASLYGLDASSGNLDRIRSAATSGDGQATVGGGALQVAGRLSGFNGSTWDRTYNNQAFTMLASATRTGDTLSPTVTVYNARHFMAILRVTARTVGASPTLRVAVNGYDGAAAEWHRLIDRTFNPTTEAHLITIGPGVGNAIQGSYLPGGTNPICAPIPLPRLLSISVYGFTDITDITYSLYGWLN